MCVCVCVYGGGGLRAQGFEVDFGIVGTGEESLDGVVKIMFLSN